MSKETKYTEEKLTYLQQWDKHLFSFRTTRHKSFKFIPGQFARLGVTKNDGSIVWRPYSIVSADYDEELEFYSIIVEDGEFTQILKNLKVGDSIYVDKTSYGLLTTDRFENGKHLWFLSTGTGLAPFISIMYDLNTWEEYDKVILVHCARTKAELTYQDTINGFFTSEIYGDLVKDKLIYVKLLTRDKEDAHLYGRITELLKNQQLEQFVGIDINKEDSRLMVCGNPDMVTETRHILCNERGLEISKRSKPGNIAIENYW